MMCKLKGQIDKGGHYDVQMYGWMQIGRHYDVQLKGFDTYLEMMVCPLCD